MNILPVINATFLMKRTKTWKTLLTTSFWQWECKTEVPWVLSKNSVSQRLLPWQYLASIMGGVTPSLHNPFRKSREEPLTSMLTVTAYTRHTPNKDTGRVGNRWRSSLVPRDAETPARLQPVEPGSAWAAGALTRAFRGWDPESGQEH